ncbi:NADPH-dependent FMN reductase [Zoogloea sp. LCSB751]|uniref:NADPH-dependent FMN reductase n=1 Tax=Zoogloea sp. LCSB751 TaxID=1965277 RepID=UPI0009A4F8C9|nr:NADPH-dependent FMN reductase [Zoogloea sp. LCSB751]
MTILTVSGSPAETSRSQHVLSHVGNMLRLRQQPVERIAVRALPADALLAGKVDEPSISRALHQVDCARALVIGTPIYKASYSGVLKVFLDLLPQGGLDGKIILPIATGGSLVHALALDYALKPVLCSLGARHLLASIFVDEAQARLVDGHLELTETIQARIEAGVGDLVQALSTTAGRA